jgi:hypothetical protein
MLRRHPLLLGADAVRYVAITLVVLLLLGQAAKLGF